MFPTDFWTGVAATIVYGIISISLLLTGYWVFDFVLKKIDFQSELKSNNTAVALVVSSFFLGLCYIVAQIVN